MTLDCHLVQCLRFAAPRNLFRIIPNSSVCVKLNAEDEKPKALLAFDDLPCFLKTLVAVEKSSYRGHLGSTTEPLDSTDSGSFFPCKTQRSNFVSSCQKVSGLKSMLAMIDLSNQ